MESPTLEEHLEALLRCPPELLPKAIFHDVRNPVNTLVYAAAILEKLQTIHVYFDAVLEYEKIRRGKDAPNSPDNKG